MSFFNLNNFYLVGIKGVAMTSIAQCLIDLGKKVKGSDVKEDFVTQQILDDLKLTIDDNFKINLPENTDCVIYTAAHDGVDNPQVQQALQRNIPTYSQAEALGFFFNQKHGIAVCGVGGKSTISAMIVWIMEKTGLRTSYSVGVGNIPGLNKTGQWLENSKYFVAEADEYVIDPAAPQKGKKIIPRFSFLKPRVIVCPNLKFDHPDVYRDFDHTKQVFSQFFNQLNGDGQLIINSDSLELLSLTEQQTAKVTTYGESDMAEWQLIKASGKEGLSRGMIRHENQEYGLELIIPGKFNLLNALAAVVTCHQLGVSVKDAIASLKSFASTMRRFEFIGEKQGIKYYDDYAHHPHEVFQAIAALNEWYPSQHKIIAFQSHTYSRTRELFDEFVDSFKDATEVVMIDIFSSAREKQDLSVSSDKLCQTISKKFPQIKTQNLKTIDALAKYLKKNLKSGDVCLTLGAGDIYLVHQQL